MWITSGAKLLNLYLFIGITLSRVKSIECFSFSLQDAVSNPSRLQCLTLNACSRREVLSTIPTSTFFLGLSTMPGTVNAATPTAADDDVYVLSEANKALSSLLENWDKATIDCTYADVPRELLETKNKEKLLEKAATSALFDKSASVVSCKKTNRIVRDYIGATGKGPLVGAEKRMLKRIVTEKIDPDNLENYYNGTFPFLILQHPKQIYWKNVLIYVYIISSLMFLWCYLRFYFLEVDSFSQALSRATSLSYTAGVADFDSVNNFAKDSENNNNLGGNSNLDQTKVAIKEANESLKNIVSILQQ